MGSKRQHARRVWMWAVTVALLGGGCGSSGKKASGGASGNGNKTAMAASMRPGGRSARPEPARRAPPAPGARAGLATWHYRWHPEVTKLNIKARAHQKAKEWSQALPYFDQALKIQPSNLDIRYKRAFVRALAGDAAGALQDLEVLLLANYPKYRYRVAVDRDFASLHKEPHLTKLKALLAQARAEHLAAWKKAVLFLGGNKRAYKLGERIRGAQEVWGYLPDTGRYVAVSYVAEGNVLAFLEVPGRQEILYVAASRYRKSFEVPAFLDPQVQILSLATGEVLHTYYENSGAGRLRLGGIPVAGKTYAKPKADAKVGAHGVLLQRLKNGDYRVSFELVAETGTAFDIEPSRHRFRIADGKVRDLGGDPVVDPKEKARSYVHVRRCGAKGRRFDWARQIRKDGGTYKLGGRAVTFPCAGLLWPTRDRSRGLFQPFRYCAKKPDKLAGLYLVGADGKRTPVSKEHGAYDLRWLDAQHALVGVGASVGYLDASTGTFRKLAVPEGFLRAYSPNAFPCPPKK